MSNAFDLDWENAASAPSENGDFLPNMKLQVGKNQVRIVSKPSRVSTHWVNLVDGGQRRIVCPGENCPICKRGEKPSNRYQMLVLDRNSDDGKKLKVLECGVSIIRLIMGFAKDKDYGDPTTYDIKINKMGSGLETKYTVIASPRKEALTPEEQKLVDEAPSIQSMNKVMTIEEIENLPLTIYGTENALTPDTPKSVHKDSKFDDDWSGV